MNPTCGCCAGIRGNALDHTYNRPGLGAIRFRIGTHSKFLEIMKENLANWPVGQDVLDSNAKTDFLFPLTGLRARDGEDPSIALLDAWALMADVLTFYQERIANEGYLRTATERFSILELGRLIGYKPRPGVAASVYFAYTLEKDNAVDVAAGSRAQSIPGPGEMPQSFETSTLLKAKDTWNNLQPRLTKPSQLTVDMKTIYVQGVSANLKVNDRLLFSFQPPTIRRITGVELDPQNNRTKVTLAGEGKLKPDSQIRSHIEFGRIAGGLIAALTKQPGRHPAKPEYLENSLKAAFALDSEVLARTATALRPELRKTLYVGLENAKVNSPQPVEVFAFRVRAAAFGHSAPLHQNFSEQNRLLSPTEWPLTKPVPSDATQASGNTEVRIIAAEKIPTESDSRISLDNIYDKILPDSWGYMERQEPGPGQAFQAVFRITDVTERSRADYGVTGRVTELTFASNKWISGKDDLSAVRSITVFGQSEKLDLAEEPMEEDIGGTSIELDGIYPGLEAGRWLIVSGERSDLPNDSSVYDAELVMLSGSTLDSDAKLPGDSLHSSVTLAEDGLGASYKRSTVKIYGNVVPATHGESRSEVLGSGSASQALQSFQLRQSPLTYVSAATPSGVESTLQVRVDHVLWHEAEQVAALGPTDRAYLTSTDDSGKTKLTFGNGIRGARVPTGTENVTASYRIGIGESGNVDVGQITMLASKPLGVKEVVNPMRASGGASGDSDEQARRNTPIAVLALDRLVSVRDYADFARAFAGIGKAVAEQFNAPDGEIVHVTIAGAEDAPIEPDSDLFRNLLAAYAKFGDPQQPVQLAVADTKLLLIQARLAVLPDYDFASVLPNVRSALLEAFSFDNRDLGQDIAASEVISVMQKVEGVFHVELTVLKTTRETDFIEMQPGSMHDLLVEGLRPDPATGRMLPAELVFLSPKVPESLIITEEPNA